MGGEGKKRREIVCSHGGKKLLTGERTFRDWSVEKRTVCSRSIRPCFVRLLLLLPPAR